MPMEVHLINGVLTVDDVDRLKEDICQYRSTDTLGKTLINSYLLQTITRAFTKWSQRKRAIKEDDTVQYPLIPMVDITFAHNAFVSSLYTINDEQEYELLPADIFGTADEWTEFMFEIFGEYVKNGWRVFICLDPVPQQLIDHLEKIATLYPDNPPPIDRVVLRAYFFHPTTYEWFKTCEGSMEKNIIENYQEVT